MLNKIKLLVKVIQSNPFVKRFRELEEVIDNNHELQQEYQIMLEKQKKMVNAKEFGRSSYKELKNDYESHKDSLLSNIIIEEYLDLQMKINEDLQMIQNIITTEINKELE